MVQALAALVSLVLLTAGGGFAQGPLHALAQTVPTYPVTIIRDSFDGANQWRMWSQPDFSAQIESGRLRMQLGSADRFAWSTADQVGPLRDVALSVDAQVERPGTFTEFGLLLRAVPQAAGTAAYIVMFSSDGKVRFGMSTPDGFRVIQDWRASGLTDPGQTARIGVFAQGSQFTVIANGKVVLSAQDSALQDAGQIGLIVGTGPGPKSTASVLYDNLDVDAPSTESGVVFPARIQNSSRAPSLIFEELQRARVIPATVRQVFVSAQSYVNNYREGFVALRLAKQTGYRDWIAMVDISWSSPRDGIACGLAARYTSDSQMDFIYIDKLGGYGMAHVSDGAVQTERYEPSPLISLQEGQSNRLIAIGQGIWTALYINGAWAATMYSPARSGVVTSAAYNYELASVRCQFDNFMVYALGE